MHDQINFSKRSPTCSLPPAVPLAIARRFRPWTHTSDDSYIYQLSLVVATATVSFLPLCVCALTSVCRTPPTRNRFRRKHGCRGPSFCPRFTSARVQHLFEFVELGCDICYICTGEVEVGTGISGWFQVVPRTLYVRDNSCLLYTSPSPRDS